MTKQNYVILGIILIIVFVLAGAVLVREKQKEPAPIPQKPPISQPPVITPPPIVTPPTNPTSPTTSTPEGWKTYENKEFGFAFDYPGDWEVEDRKRDDTRASFDIFDMKFREQQVEEFDSGGGTDAPLTGLSLGIFNLTNDIKDFIQVHYDEPPVSIIRKEDVKFSNGIHALRIMFNIDPYGEKQSILFYSENYVAEFFKWVTGPGPLYESMERTFDQIISTFRFLE